jgi:hypothetical protein
MDAKELIEKYKAGHRVFDKLELQGIDLSWEQLPEVSFQGADLYGAKLTGTILTGAELSGGVNLTHADLGRADLTGANLCGADLRGANLRDATLTDIRYDDATQFPRGFSPAGTTTQINPTTINPATTAALPTADTALATPSPAPTQISPPPEAVNPSPQPPTPGTLVHPPVSPVTMHHPAPLSPNVPTQPVSSPRPAWLMPVLVGSAAGVMVVLAGLALFRQPPGGQMATSPETMTGQGARQSDSNAALTSRQLSEAEAVNLVRYWLQSKQTILAPPYDRQVTYDLTTDVLFRDLTKPGGSIGWLENNNAYYRFGVQRIDQVEQFSSDGSNATLVLQVTEERTLFVNGRIDYNETDFKTRRVRYSLQFVDGRWKIADYQ